MAAASNVRFYPHSFGAEVRSRQKVLRNLLKEMLSDQSQNFIIYEIRFRHLCLNDLFNFVTASLLPTGFF